MSFFIADIYDALKLAVSPSLIYISIICLVTFILFFVNDIYQLNRLRAQELLLLTTIDVEYYQYKGNLLFIQFLNTCSLFVAYFSSCTKISVRILFISFTFIALLTYLQVGYAMLLGSNSGVISICCSFLVFVGYLIFIYKTTKYTKASINFYNLNKCTLISIFLFGSIAFIFADNILFHIIDILDSMMIDTSRIRLFGYGSELTSFTARHDIMKNNFMTHFLYNPLTGNMYVDYYTTGGGTYVHNILSFITHTGIIGFMFFAWFVIQSYKGMFHHAHDIDTLYYNHAYSVYRVMFLSLILLFGSLSSFLTWAPLWFGIGCFALNFISPQLGVTE
jgi:hypothetical protein